MEFSGRLVMTSFRYGGLDPRSDSWRVVKYLEMRFIGSLPGNESHSSKASMKQSALFDCGKDFP
jgi:hypothetical protein